MALVQRATAKSDDFIKFSLPDCKQTDERLSLIGKHGTLALYSMRFGKKEKKLDKAVGAAHPAVWRFALAMTGRRDVADDLAQSTVVRALERQHQFTTGSIEAWCITICRSIWLNELRAQAVRDRSAISLADTTTTADVFPDSETNIFAREVFTQVMELPEAQRETVALVYVSGFTYREAAEILDVPIGTVMSRLSAARKKLMDWNAEKDVRKEDKRCRPESLS